MKLYQIADGFVFAVACPGFVNAWGDRMVYGTMFDTVDGTVQTEVFFSGPEWFDDDLVIRSALGAQFNKRVARVLTLV